MNLQNKTIVLTGATGGIGTAFARALADSDSRLILVSRSQTELETLCASLHGTGHRIVVADITADQGRQAVADACSGGVDILVNNAGVNHFGLLSEQTEEQIRTMFEVNSLAPILLVQALLPAMSAPESAIVNVGSGFGSIGFAGYCGYSASKFALRGFTEALRRELADRPVSVCYLAPRATATNMNPDSVVAMNEELGNAMDDPEVVARDLISLLEKPRAARFLGWPERFFVKLNSVFPTLVDHALYKQLPVIRRYAIAAKLKAG